MVKPQQLLDYPKKKSMKINFKVMLFVFVLLLKVVASKDWPKILRLHFSKERI
jgi:hypothetical protein